MAPCQGLGSLGFRKAFGKLGEPGLKPPRNRRTLFGVTVKGFYSIWGTKGAPLFLGNAHILVGALKP